MSSGKNILIITNMFPSEKHPSYGIFVKNIAYELSKHYSVSLIKIDNPSKRLSEKAKNYLSIWIKSFFYILHASNDSILYAHYPSHTCFGILAFPFKKGKLIIHFHGSDVIIEPGRSKLFHKIKTYINRLAANRADLIVVPSNYFKGIVAKKLNIKKDIICVYPSGGVDINVFRPKNKPLGNQAIVLGFVGRIVNEKGIFTFLNAIKLINDKGINCKGIIVGSGTEEKQVFQFVRKMNLDVQIKPIMNHSDLANEYNNMDLFVFPTEREAESLGLVALEALACGIPVVASKISAVNEYIKPGYNGFLFNVKDVEDLANKVELYHRMDLDEKLKYRRNARESIKKYRVEKVTQEFLCEIDKL